MDIPGFVEAHKRVYEVALQLRVYQPFFCVGDIIEAYKFYCHADIDYEKFGFSSIEDFLQYGHKDYKRRIFPACSPIPGLFVCLLVEDYEFANILNSYTVFVDCEPSDFPEFQSNNNDPPIEKKPDQAVRAASSRESIPPPASPDEELRVDSLPLEAAVPDGRDILPAPGTPVKESSSSESEDEEEPPTIAYNPAHFFLKANMRQMMLDCLKKAEWVTLAEVSEAYNAVYPTKFDEDCDMVGCGDIEALTEMCKREVIVRQNDEGLWICELPENKRLRVEQKREVRNFLSYQVERERYSMSRSPSPVNNNKRGNRGRRGESERKSPVREKERNENAVRDRQKRELKNYLTYKNEKMSSSESRSRSPLSKKNRKNRGRRGESMRKSPVRGKERSPARWLHDKFRDDSPKRPKRGERKSSPRPRSWQHDDRFDKVRRRNKKKENSPLQWVHDMFDNSQPPPRRGRTKDRGCRKGKESEKEARKRRKSSSDSVDYSGRSRERHSEKHKKRDEKKEKPKESDDSDLWEEASPERVGDDHRKLLNKVWGKFKKTTPPN